MNRIKQSKIFSNPGLKIASLVIAFILWLIIMNVSDPMTLKTFSGVTVTFSNASYLEGRNRAYEVDPGSTTIDVTVHTHRSSVERLSSSNITAVADLTQIIDFGSDPVLVPVKVSVPGVNADSVTVSPRNIEIKLETLTSKSFVVNTTTGDTRPANGYEVGAMEPSTDKITVRGSASLVNSIDKIQAQVDVSSLKSNADLSATLHIFDKNGNELSETQKSYLTFVNVEENDLKVHVTLYQVDTDVRIEAQTYGKPKEGYQVGDIDLTPDTVSIVGDEASLEAFRAAGNTIVIDEESAAVDVSEATSDRSVNVDLNNFLPEGIRLAEGLSSTVVVQVQIIPYDSKSFSLDSRSIVRNNLDSNLNAVFNEGEISVRVRGSAEELPDLNVNQITASVDFSGMKEGTYTVDVDVSLPSGYTLVEPVKAAVTISKNEPVSGTS
ncbi:MAG: CdaR family protein [Lachnospiraceae bacterium]|nr:CdaR family protein [Lachnospiraceae bacterium]